MLEKEPEKRIQLMDFQDTEYYKMDDDEFKALHMEFEAKNPPPPKEEEQK